MPTPSDQPSLQPINALGDEVRRLRKAAKLTQQALADRTHYSRSYIALIETGREHPSAETLQRIGTALHDKRALLYLLREPARPPAAEDAEIASIVELSRRATSSRLSNDAVEGIERAAARLSREYSSTKPNRLAPQVHQYLAAVVRLLENKVTLSQHQRLLAVSGWLALLLSALHHDLKDREIAKASREAAYQFGHEAGDNEVVSWSFETRAWFALADNNFRDAIGHARAGQAVAPSKTSASVSTTMQEVRATARLGDRVAAERALLRADAALERMPAPEHPENHFTFDPPKLSFYAATAYVWLGDSKRAEEHARRVITENGDAASPNYWPTRVATTFVELGLAIALRGDLDEAADAAQPAFDSDFTRRSTLWRAAELDRLLLAGDTKVHEVQRFHERYTLRRIAVESASRDT